LTGKRIPGGYQFKKQIKTAQKSKGKRNAAEKRGRKKHSREDTLVRKEAKIWSAMPSGQPGRTKREGRVYGQPEG